MRNRPNVDPVAKCTGASRSTRGYYTSSCRLRCRSYRWLAGGSIQGSADPLVRLLVEGGGQFENLGEIPAMRTDEANNERVGARIHGLRPALIFISSTPSLMTASSVSGSGGLPMRSRNSHPSLKRAVRVASTWSAPYTYRYPWRILFLYNTPWRNPAPRWKPERSSLPTSIL